MKKALFFSSLMLLALLSIQGCDAISSATSKDFPLMVTLPLDAGGPGGVMITKGDTVDLAALSDDFEKYKDHVNSLTIDSAWWEVESASSGLILNDGKYSFADINNGSLTKFSEVKDVNLSQVAGTGKMPLTFEKSVGQQFADLLKKDGKAVIILNETLNQQGTYSIKLIFKMTMNAGVL
jgi:hypothetical protein